MWYYHYSMKFEIRNVKNGAVLTVEEDGETEEVVYQGQGDNEVEAFADFLRFLETHYGPATSRYSPQRIYIKVAPGDKYTG